jgi:hypothetical protein
LRASYGIFNIYLPKEAFRIQGLLWCGNRQIDTALTVGRYSIVDKGDNEMAKILTTGEREVIQAELQQVFDERVSEVLLGVFDRIVAHRLDVSVHSEDIRDLQQIVAELVVVQTRTGEQLETLATAQTRTEQRLEELTIAQQQTEVELKQLTQDVRQLTQGLAETRNDLGELSYVKRYADFVVDIGKGSIEAKVVIKGQPTFFETMYTKEDTAVWTHVEPFSLRQWLPLPLKRLPLLPGLLLLRLQEPLRSQLSPLPMAHGEKIAKEAARIILDDYPGMESKNEIKIEVCYGYDIGILFSTGQCMSLSWRVWIDPAIRWKEIREELEKK